MQRKVTVAVLWAGGRAAGWSLLRRLARRLPEPPLAQECPLPIAMERTLRDAELRGAFVFECLGAFAEVWAFHAAAQGGGAFGDAGHVGIAGEGVDHFFGRGEGLKGGARGSGDQA